VRSCGGDAAEKSRVGLGCRLSVAVDRMVIEMHRWPLLHHRAPAVRAVAAIGPGMVAA
jgi:hypothetical protein